VPFFAINIFIWQRQFYFILNVSALAIGRNQLLLTNSNLSVISYQ